METSHLYIENIPAIIWGLSSNKIFLYVHGQGGNKEEAKVFASIANRYGWQVLSIDLPDMEKEKKNETYLIRGLLYQNF